VIVIIVVADKTARLHDLKRLFFKRQTKYYPVKQKPMPPLAFCILMDLIGYASFSIPIFGELFDLLWAPVSAVIYMKLFGGVKGFFGGAFSFVEELLPGTDLIPTFTITWFLQYSKRKNQVMTIEPVTD
jgi:hypothetical protein